MRRMKLDMTASGRIEIVEIKKGYVTLRDPNGNLFTLRAGDSVDLTLDFKMDA